jgi:hypothetical protein
MISKEMVNFSPPVELDLDCDQINKDNIKCSQAFPDIIHFKDRFYLAFRSAPSHFPSRLASIHIFSTQNTQDFTNWQPEHSLADDLDIRDPHFLQFKGDLYLFFISHSNGLFNHEPEHIHYIKKTTHGWSAPSKLPIHKSGFWNIKAHEGRIYMSIYTRNGAGKQKTRRHLQFIVSYNLSDWEIVYDSPLAREKLGWYQTSEAAFAFDNQGAIFGTIRSVIYPNLNFSIPENHSQEWKLKVDRFKCDGPNLFQHNGQSFLVGRRSLYHRLPSQPYRLFHNLRKAINVMRYSLSRKRTAIYRFDPHKLEIRHISDLPSHGDTGYSSVARLEDNKYLLIYYSSDIKDGKDLNWLRGQVGRTKLYASILTIDPGLS